MKPYSASVWIGYDTRWPQAFAVARQSAARHMTAPIPIYGVHLAALRQRGLYTRPTENRDGKLWDTISGAAMSTEFALSRFLVPHLAREKCKRPPAGWALFMDCDMLVLGNLMNVFNEVDNKYAVMCVKHDHKPDNTVKMDGQVQAAYGRKNWSSMMLFNCDHPSNVNLTLDLINTARGLHLHQFCWLRDDEIGEIGPQWNHLVRHSPAPGRPQIVHFTDGIPDMPGYENDPFANEWREELRQWVN